MPLHNFANFTLTMGSGLKTLCAFKILVQQVVKRMGRTVPIENLPWPIVEHGLHPLDLGTGDLLKSRPLRKELAQQPVGVLIRPPLPGTLGMGKVDPHLRLLREEPVLAFLGLGHR